MSPWNLEEQSEIHMEIQKYLKRKLEYVTEAKDAKIQHLRHQLEVKTDGLVYQEERANTLEEDLRRLKAEAEEAASEESGPGPDAGADGHSHVNDGTLEKSIADLPPSRAAVASLCKAIDVLVEDVVSLTNEPSRLPAERRRPGTADQADTDTAAAGGTAAAKTAATAAVLEGSERETGCVMRHVIPTGMLNARPHTTSNDIHGAPRSLTRSAMRHARPRTPPVARRRQVLSTASIDSTEGETTSLLETDIAMDMDPLLAKKAARLRELHHRVRCRILYGIDDEHQVFCDSVTFQVIQDRSPTSQNASFQNYATVYEHESPSIPPW